MSYSVTVRYSDGATRTMPVEAGQTLLDAAEANGIPIVSECESGVCGTCVGRCTKGFYELGPSIGLNQSEKAQRRILSCQTRVKSDCVVELEYPLANNAARIVAGDATVTQIEQLSPSAALLTLDVSQLPDTLTFKPGQFAQLRIPGSDVWRSYSYAHAASGAEVSFLIRLLPAGVMSDYLRGPAKIGDRIEIRGSKGGFYLRNTIRPVLLIAGGTGLSAILALAEQLAEENCAQPVHLIYGVTESHDLVLTQRLEAAARKNPNFRWDTIVKNPAQDWTGHVGLVSDLLPEVNLYEGDIDIYLCGPAAMVDATRDWLEMHGFANANLYYEKFVPSGAKKVAQAALAMGTLDLEDLKREGRGRAIVIGGSIAGISSAKVLTETFGKVTVLEADPGHRRMEGRPGAAQGWHLHHLLIGGQRQLETIFPGVIDDMVEAGAFKVDMGEQYRLMLAGSWKKVAKTGIEIICAGRPLMEWCVRRRLDREPTIDYHYDSAVRDIVLDHDGQTVIGVVVEHDGAERVVPAEFVVDAAGKNTPLPAILARHGFEAPEIDEDHINCFYSSMQHRVPPERVWRDKVSVICYAQRPQQQHYAAQYFIDQSRTVMMTSLIGYNCYTPPRNAQEFREFARLMPSQAIGDELDGLEPCSPVYNFRYPTMQRFRYEHVRRLPAGLVAVGDSYSSADPVSGAGMTKALLELNELRSLLRTKAPRDEKFVHRYYKKISKMSDLIWLVVREQNLRFAWIENVKKKRPFYFRLHNWYVDRVLELIHEDPSMYRLYLMVTHFVEPPTALLRPRVVARVVGKWLGTRLRFKKTLIEQNFGSRKASLP